MPNYAQAAIQLRYGTHVPWVYCTVCILYSARYNLLQYCTMYIIHCLYAYQEQKLTTFIRVGFFRFNINRF